MERGFQIPQIGTKKALLIEKNMPAEGMMKVLKQAEEDRKNGSVVTIAVMKKNKKFQKEQVTKAAKVYSGGLAAVTRWVRLKYAAMNLKKLAQWS